MQIYNWKKSSDFLPLLDHLRSVPEDIVVVLGKNIPLGWYHIGLIRSLFQDRSIIFITRQERVRRLLKQAGYRVYASTKEIHRLLPEGFQIIQENLSVMDYLRFQVLHFFGRFYFLVKKFRPNQGVAFSVKHSSWYVLVLGIVTVLLLMVGIVSLTIPHATLIITPQTSIQNAIKNVVFVPADMMTDPSQIPLQREVFPYEFTKTYTVNTYDPTSLLHARGHIRITNTGTEALRLRTGSRIAAGTLVFRSDKPIDIPGAVDSKPGEVSVTITADSVGSDGVLIGKKGNIAKGTPLIFPGLSATDHASITLVAEDDFTGGDDTSKPLLTQEEYSRIEKIFREQLAIDARDYATRKYDNGSNFIPLPIPEALKTLDTTVNADVAVGTQSNQITFTGKANFSLYLYDVTILRKILLATAQSHLLEHTESLIEISNSPPDVIAVITSTVDPFMIKVTAQIPVQILYDFTSPTGQKTLQNILSDLLDADVDRAQKTLLNHPYVKSVDIRLTPFWSNKLPNTLDDISIKVKEANN